MRRNDNRGFAGRALAGAVGPSDGPRPRRRALVGAFVPLVVGIVFVAFPIAALQANRVDDGWRTAQGKVVREVATKTRQGIVLTQFVSYEVDGQTFEVERTLGNTKNDSIIGRPMEVAYDPSKPSDAKVVESILGSWLVAVFFAIGVLLLGFTALGLVRAFRRRAEASP